MNMVLFMPMNVNTRNLKIGVKFKIFILFTPLYYTRYGLWFNKWQCLLTLQTEQIIRNEYRTLHQNFKNYSSQLNLFLYIQLFGLIALAPLEPSFSLTDALFCSDKRSWSRSASTTCSLLYAYAALLSPQDWSLTCRPLSYIRLIACLEASMRLWISLLKHSLCRSYTSGNVWSRLFYLFLAWDDSQVMTSRVSQEIAILGATVLCYNIL